MSSKEFVRKHKEDKPVVAICYDFDKTLSPNDMQAQGYIQSIDYDVKEFWTESNSLAEDNDMDQNLAYMYKMVDCAEGHLMVKKEKLAEYGSKVQLFPGVVDWFERIRTYGKRHGVIVEHYIISSGLKEMIEGTEMAKNGAFEKIYASSYYFNKNGIAVWPAQVVNYTNKTQFLFRIEKGILDINDPGVNDYFPQEEMRVPFRNMIYIGDSDTDIPCMKLVNSHGGHSIGVYNPETRDKEKVHKMMRDDRIKFFAAADYTENSDLDKLVKAIIERTSKNEKLESLHYNNKREVIEAERADKRNEEDQRKDSLIAGLRSSRSFAFTHLILSQLKEYTHWKEEQVDELCAILISNMQVAWILGDEDVSAFYLKLLNKRSLKTEDRIKANAMLENCLCAKNEVGITVI